MVPSERFDIVIVGGGLGGVAAALSAARLGQRSVLVCETDWVGGQLTSQCIPPDEHPWIESVGCTRTYREFRNRVRDFYRRNYPLTAAARSTSLLNPGSGNIGPLSHEPQVARLVLEEMLAPWVSRGLITVIRSSSVVGAVTTDTAIVSVTVEDHEASQRTLHGQYYLDATDLGDLIEAADVEHVFGAESRDDTGELHAVDGPAQPLNQQAITWAMMLSWNPREDNTVCKPAEYDFWRDYIPANWPGPLLSWQVNDHVTNQPRQRPLFTNGTSTSGLHYDLWHARRVLDGKHFTEPWPDITVAAWPMMDYSRLPLLGVPSQATQRALEESKALSLSFLYWMQTEAPRHDGGLGYPELAPREDLSGGPHGLAKMPYIRESRRIKAELTLLEQHIGVEAREGATGAERFDDSIGICAYRIDVHPSTSGQPAIDIDSWPFQVPLRSLIPVRITNLLPAAKNIGSTHLTSGAYRVHPGEWTIGEAAGALAAFCITDRLLPRQVSQDERSTSRYQTVLTSRVGIELEWPQYDALTPTRRFGYAKMGKGLTGG